MKRVDLIKTLEASSCVLVRQKFEKETLGASGRRRPNQSAL